MNVNIKQAYLGQKNEKRKMDIQGLEADVNGMRKNNERHEKR